LAYAHRHWAYHCRLALDDGDAVERARKFIEKCESYPALVPVAGFYALPPFSLTIAYHIPPSLISLTVADDEKALAKDTEVSSPRKRLSPLTLAIIYDNKEAAERLLALPNPKLNEADVDGWTELHYACQTGRTSILELILRQSNVNVNAKDNNGWTPMMRACSRGDEACVKLLLAAQGVDINAVDNRQSCALIMAAMKGYDTIVGLLVARGEVQPNLVDEAGWTALMHAANGGHEGAVKQLLVHDKVDVNYLPPDGTSGAGPALSALMISCLQAKDGVAKPLLADPRLNGDKLSALLLAADGGLGETVKAFVASPFNVHQAGFEGTTALMAAAAQGHAGVVKLLLPGANINATDDNGDTALVMAAESGDEETVRLLLGVPGINVGAGKNGRSAMSVAKAKGHTRIMKLLRGPEAMEDDEEDDDDDESISDYKDALSGDPDDLDYV
jgi:ankyrin repeat protein